MGDIEIKQKGLEQPLRVVFKVIERTIKANGQMLLTPQIEAETYWTLLTDPAYKLSSYITNTVRANSFTAKSRPTWTQNSYRQVNLIPTIQSYIWEFMAYNILCLIGQESIKKSDAPLKKKVQRRQIRTVIQNYITLAARLVHHSRKYKLGFSRYSPWFTSFKQVYMAFTP